VSYLAIDPGLDTGWAFFSDREHMTACGLSDPTAQPFTYLVKSVAIEKPKIYAARKMKGDPNDIITLAIQVGDLKGYYARLGKRVALVTPNDWKGGTAKDVSNERTIGGMSLEERAIVKRAAYYIPTSKQHNLLDAIGLGRACFIKKLWLA
jgi:hypothetical protein